MVILVSGHLNPIETHQKLPVDSSNAKHTRNHVNDAWIMICDYGKKLQTVKLFATISWAMKLGFDCKSFLGGLAMYWNQEKVLNCVGTWKTDFKFSLIFSILIMVFLQQLVREWDLASLHMYMWMQLGQQLGLGSIALMFGDSS